MKGLIAWFAENGVAANLLMIVILAGGGLAIWGLRPTIIPDIDTGLVTVSVTYPGATPAEVEESICVRIEEEIQSVNGIKRLTSTAFEGLGQVTAELFQDADLRTVLANITNKVDGIATFPRETEKPVIQELPFQFEVVSVAVSGSCGERVLRAFGERVRDDLSVLPGITKVELAGIRSFEVSVEVSEYALRKYGLTFDEVADAVRRSSLDLPGGSVKAEGGEILLRTSGQSYTGRQFEELVLRTGPGGSRVLLGDVARVVDGFEETESRTRFNGEPAVMVQVFRIGKQDSLAISATVARYVAKARASLPDGVALTIWRDNSKFLESRLDLLIRNGRIGLLLVFICLALFLRLGMALWVAAGIPVSFMGALWLMPGLDVTINMISLFGFVIVLGIVVDDAIVVGENVHTHFQKGKSALQAVKDGTIEVAVPVVFAVLTTIAAFSPMLGLPGRMGQFARNIPLVVVACLSFSLIEALLVLPAHLRHMRPEPARHRGPARVWAGFQGIFTRGLRGFIDAVYRPVLAWTIRWRYLTLALATALLLLCAGLVGGGHLRLTFFPEMEADNVAAALTMPRGTPVEVTARAIERIEAAARQLRAEVDRGMKGRPSVLRHISSSVGTQPFRTLQRRQAGDLRTLRASSHLGEVTLELAPAESRTIGSREIAERWREICGPIPDAVELTFTSSLVASDDIDIRFTALDIDTLRAATDGLRGELARIPGVIDITDTLRNGKEEVRLHVKPAGEALGLRVADLARQVRQAFWGEEAQRVQRGRDDVPVMVRYPREDRTTLASLEDMRIRTQDGAGVPFSTVAGVEFGRGFAEITRTDRRRSADVLAKVAAGTNANEVKQRLAAGFLPRLVARYPGLHWSEEGAGREQTELLAGILRAFVFALIAIYGMLAVVFRSYVQPMIVMSVIPFGVVGAVAGHILAGLDLSFMSFIGTVALTGIVVNDSLVMVDFVNRARRGGATLHEAVLESGAARFRPILLTSLTTFAGLTPILLEKSLQAQFLIPAAVALAFGVLFATLITLVLVPCGYWILEDSRHAFAALWGRRPASLPSLAR